MRLAASQRRIYFSGAIACLVIVGIFVDLITNNHSASHRHPTQRESHASVNIAAIEAAAHHALAVASVVGSPMDIGFPVISNDGTGLGLPMTTDGGEDAGPGSHTLAFACAGIGQIEATLSIGKSTTRVKAACGLQPEPSQLSLMDHHPGQLYVQFAALKRETVAIAYELASNTS